MCGMNDCNEWKVEKRHECTYTETANNLNYDDSCMLCCFQSGTYEISGRLIFVVQSVHMCVYVCLCVCLFMCLYRYVHLCVCLFLSFIHSFILVSIVIFACVIKIV
jgi:hypothetical protein